ncbi:MAG: NAD-dependent epimerase/dehydratase family protein [Bdellovibrionales bacterium]|nr:NAD-dependent epimerase/dehydratase family protein [Bdellovibrionales bacterium]
MESATKVLLTGSSGFIGRHFISDFKRHYDIRTTNLRALDPSQIDFLEIETVVHCAGLAHQMDRSPPEEEYFEVNCNLSVKLAKAAKEAGVLHFIYFSTSHVFGDSGTLSLTNPPLSPASSCHPTDGYGKSKLAAEKELLSLSSKSFTVSIVRPPLVYGRGAKGNIPRLGKLIQRIPILPLGYGKNRRSLIYIGNLTAFIDTLIRKKRRAFSFPKTPNRFQLKLLQKELQRPWENDASLSEFRVGPFDSSVGSVQKTPLVFLATWF